MAVEHPAALRADFQQYYGLNVDGMGRDYSTLHAADLLTMLPEGSRVAACYDEDSAWTSDRTLMAAMVNDLNWLVWSKTNDAQKGRNKPKMAGPFRDPRERREAGMAMTVEELNERLGITPERLGADDG